jgi:hypothetical protein
MVKQQWLAFLEEERLERLWEGFPEQARREVTEHYARLMARAALARIRALRKSPEVGDEPSQPG